LSSIQIQRRLESSGGSQRELEAMVGAVWLDWREVWASISGGFGGSGFSGFVGSWVGGWSWFCVLGSYCPRFTECVGLWLFVCGGGAPPCWYCL
jgi:hypothetical protein